MTTAPGTTSGTRTGTTSGTAATTTTGLVTVRYFAAAAEAAGTTTEQVPAATLGELRTAMVARHGADLARVLTRCSLLHEGRRVSEDDTPVPAGAVVDVLPPFAGG